MNPIPIFTIEEHHEAYLLWRRAIAAGILPAQGGSLLHIDHHDDMEAGAYPWDMRAGVSDQQAEEFTYQALGIADFIIPALYHGLFSELLILKSLLPIPMVKQERWVMLRGDDALICGNYLPFLHHEQRQSGNGNKRFFDQYSGGLSPFCPGGPAVLDIDLDYFAWDDSLSGVPDKLIEITVEAYREFQADPCHPFRILPRRLVQVCEREGRYYLQYREYSRPNAPPTPERLQKRIGNFAAWLRENDIRPALISLCRSAHSGYLPPDLAPTVEAGVREALGQLYELDIRTRI